MLQDLDQVEWRNDHVPALLRTIADGADDFTGKLYACLTHQGTILPDAVPAVPFLLELARDAPSGRAEVAGVVAYLAGSRSTTAWEAVVARINEVVALTADPDSAVRTSAYLTLSHCRVTYPAAALWRRWSVEDDSTARLALLLALGARDPERSEHLLTETVSGDVAGERVAAVLALHRARLPLPSGAADAVASAFTSGADLGRPLGMAVDGAIREVVAHSADLGFVGEFLSAAVRPGSPRSEDGIWALAGRLEVSRSAPARYLPLLRPFLTTTAALSVAGTGGLGIAVLADELAGVADRLPEGDGDQRLAVRALLRLGDPRWVAPACAMWSGAGSFSPVRMYGPIGDELISALAQQLTRATLRADESVASRVASFIALLQHTHGGNPAGDGTAKRIAGLVPALRAAVGVAPVPVLRALLAVGAATDEDVHTLASAADGEAVVEWCRRTGDAELLGPWLAERLTDREPAQHLRAVLPAGAALAAIAPQVRPLLADADPAVRFAAAHVLHVAGEPEPALPRIAGALAAGRTSARYAAELADASHEPLLRAVLDDSAACLAAARALVRLGVSRDDLTDAVVRGVRAGADRVDVAAITAACRDLAGDRARTTLLDLADRDIRITDGGEPGSVIWRDELWRDTVRSALI